MFMTNRNLFNWVKNKLIKLQYEGFEPYKKPAITPEEQAEPVGKLLGTERKDIKPVQAPVQLMAAPAAKAIDTVAVENRYAKYLQVLQGLYADFYQDNNRNPSKDELDKIIKHFYEEQKNDLRFQHDPAVRNFRNSFK
jgi:hypothetical protein